MVVDLKARIHEMLDNAVENGYPPHPTSAAAIAEDLRGHDPDLEGYDAHILVPHVRSWLARRKGEELPVYRVKLAHGGIARGYVIQKSLNGGATWSIIAHGQRFATYAEAEGHMHREYPIAQRP